MSLSKFGINSETFYFRCKKHQKRLFHRTFATTSGGTSELSVPQSKKGARISGLLESDGGSDAEKSRKIGFAAFALFVVPMATFSLGVWQVKRRKWKIRLIDSLERRLSAEPVSFRNLGDDLSDLEYTPVEVWGEFDHTREFVISPRVRSESTPAPVRQGPPLEGDQMGHGGHVVTPFVVSKDGKRQEILINRGWVAKAQLNPSSRSQGQMVGPQKLVGILRLSEKKPAMMHENEPERNGWFYRDVEAMARHAGTLPIYLEATLESSVDGGPLGGQTNVNLRNEHLQYIVTWFSLSALTSYLWYLRFFKF